MIPVITRSILHLRQMTWKQLIRSMKKWDASASKIRQGAFTLSEIRTDTGWKSCRRNNTVG